MSQSPRRSLSDMGQGGSTGRSHNKSSGPSSGMDGGKLKLIGAVGALVVAGVLFAWQFGLFESRPRVTGGGTSTTSGTTETGGTEQAPSEEVLDAPAGTEAAGA